jgi:lipoprotein-releasing system permease protein
VYRLFLAFRYLRSRLVNLISVGGVMAGVAVLISVVAIMDGFQARVRSVVRGTLSHLILTPTANPEDVPGFAVLEQQLLAADPHVQAASPHVILPIFYEYETNVRSVTQMNGRALHQMEADGVDFQHERHVSEFEEHLLVAYDMERPFFHPVASEREKTTVLVSRTFAERFMLGQFDAEGRPVHAYGALNDAYGARLEGKALVDGCRELICQELRILWPSVDDQKSGERSITGNSKNTIISGVYDAHDAVEDNVRLYLEIDEARRMAGLDFEFLRVNVRLDDYEHAEAVKRTLNERFGHLFLVETWEDQKADFLRAVNQEKVLLVIVLSFIVLLGGFIILATLTLTVVEKTRDIGIVGALGASRLGILSIFVWNGLLIGIIGSILGLGLGKLFTNNVNWVKDRLADMGVEIFPPDIYHFREIPTAWDWPSVFMIMIGSVVVAFLAGLLPALRASRLDPVKALRYE